MRIEPEEKLNARVARLWRVHAAIGWGILSAVCALVLFIMVAFAGFSVSVIVAPVAALAAGAVVLIGIFPGVRYRRWRFRVSDDEIVLRRGILIVRTTVVPMIKIQYTDTQHGPIMRAMKLATVRVMTAGGTEEIPGLPPDEAGALADRITALVKLVRENV